MPADPGRESVGVRSFNEGSAHMSVARLGDAPPRDALPTGVFRGNQAEIGHQSSRVFEAAQIPDLREGRDRHDRSHAPQGLESLDHRIPPPFGKELQNLIRHPSRPLRAFPNRRDVFLQDDLLGMMRKSDVRQPTHMGRGPRLLARIALSIPQEKRAQLLVGSLQGLHRVFSGPGKVAHGLILFRGNMDRRQFARPLHPRQGLCIPTVILDSVSAFPGSLRRSHHLARISLPRQVPIDLVPTRSGFIDKVQGRSSTGQFPNRLVQRIHCAPDTPKTSDLHGPKGVCRYNLYRVLVNIESHNCDRISHSLPPYFWLCI